MFHVIPCASPGDGAKLLLNGARLCGFDEPSSYELQTAAGQGPLYVDVMLSQKSDDPGSRTTIGRIAGNRLAVTICNPSASVTTTSQSRHQIVYMAESRLQLTFAFCCIPLAPGKFLCCHEFYEESFPSLR
jgi:hypothetical protein